MGLDKEYIVDARFGAVSTTLDREGEITETGVVPLGDLNLPSGELEQVPPKFSALHVNGKRAYELARSGVEFELEPRQVRVDEFEETDREADRRSFRVRCGSGTYIRSLIADLGDAYCEELRRISIGPFAVPNSLGDDGSQRVELVDALSQILPVLQLDADQSALLAHGRPVELTYEIPELAVALGPEGLVAIAGVNENGFLASRVGFVG